MQVPTGYVLTVLGAFQKSAYGMRQQTAGTNSSEMPSPKPHKIKHVDVLAWICRLRVAPSRTSPISTFRSQYCTFVQVAVHTHPTRRDITSAR